MRAQLAAVKDIGRQQLLPVRDGLERIPLEKSSIPCRMVIRINGEDKALTFHYNDQGDFFTVDVAGDVKGAKLVYGREVSGIKPYDLANEETRVSWDNLGVSVFLFAEVG